MENDAKANTTPRMRKLQTPTRSAAELGQIAAEVEAFLEMWVARLEHVLGHYEHGSADDAKLQERIAEFELARRRWNEERRRDVEQIQETTEQLSAAWERLEEEQRQILHTQSPSLPRAPQREAPKIANAPEVPSPAELQSSDAASAARDRAVRQFQKLRRQIGPT